MGKKLLIVSAMVSESNDGGRKLGFWLGLGLGLGSGLLP